MYLSQALEAALLERDQPVTTDYDFYGLGLRLFREGVWNSAPIKRLPDEWDQQRMRAALRRLVKRQVLAQDIDFRSGVWRVVQSTRSGAAEEIACIADPFCYVSHLSAMHRYGLTERSPEALHLTTPARSLWSSMRDRKVATELGEHLHVEHPPLLRFGFKETIRRRPVVVHETSHPAVPSPIRGEHTRISSIGRTFADMISQPLLCGGIRHVLAVWENEAERWLDEIISSVDEFDTQIVKMRAGYILSERLDIDDPRIARWERFAQRGGSRKLDPDAPYAARYSERWMLSLNA